MQVTICKCVVKSLSLRFTELNAFQLFAEYDITTELQYYCFTILLTSSKKITTLVVGTSSVRYQSKLEPNKKKTSEIRRHLIHKQ